MDTRKTLHTVLEANVYRFTELVEPNKTNITISKRDLVEDYTEFECWTSELVNTQTEVADRRNIYQVQQTA